MPISTVVPAPSIVFDQELTWPVPAANDTLSVNLGVPVNRALYQGSALIDQSQVDSISRSNASTGAGTFRLIAGLGGVPQGFPFIRLDSPGAGYLEQGLEGFAAIGSTNQTTLPPGLVFPSSMRVYHLSVLWRYFPVAGPIPAANYGFLMVPQNAPTHGWPLELVGAQNRGGFGLVSDGAGQWVYRSFNRAGVGLIRETVALPPHTLDAWHQFEYQILFDRPGLPASMEFWFNGNLVLTRNWQGALLEPKTAVNEYNFTPRVRVDDQGQFCFVMHMKRGRFTRAGLEIQG